MKSFFIAMVLSTLLVSCTKTAPRVLLFMRDGSDDLEYMLKKEVGVMKNTLERSGFKVVVATLDGSTFAAGSARVEADLSLAEVDVNDYAGFILPCMAAGTSANPMISSGLVALVQKAVSAGKPVAAETGAVFALGQAGLLKGKKYASTGELTQYEGGIYSGSGVVRDGLILTSAICPYMARMLKTDAGTEQLTLLLIEAMKGEE